MTSARVRADASESWSRAFAQRTSATFKNLFVGRQHPARTQASQKVNASGPSLAGRDRDWAAKRLSAETNQLLLPIQGARSMVEALALIERSPGLFEGKKTKEVHVQINGVELRVRLGQSQAGEAPTSNTLQFRDLENASRSWWEGTTRDEREGKIGRGDFIRQANTEPFCLGADLAVALASVT
jgi:hypothetical protein